MRTSYAVLIVVLLTACAQPPPPPTNRSDSGAVDSGRSDLGPDSRALDTGSDDTGGADVGMSCPTGQAFCAGACRDLSLDPSHCGVCDLRCEAGSVCGGGECSVMCAGGTSNCAGSCVNTGTDEMNCGGCGMMCSGGQVCTGGTCTSVCGAAETFCGGSCVNTSTDLAHCGACNNTCAFPNAAAGCTASSCQITACAAGHANCDGAAANGCERAVSCTTGSACTTACGSTGATNCESLCAISCTVPAESCNARDDDCDGSCDELSGCRQGVFRSWDTALPNGGVGHIYSLSRTVAEGDASRNIEHTNYFWLYSDNPGGFVALHRCRLNSSGNTNFLAGSTCEGAGTSVERLGYMAGTPTCGAVPLYRLYNGSNNDHYYTHSAAERDNAINVHGYRFESIAGYVFLAEHG